MQLKHINKYVFITIYVYLLGIRNLFYCSFFRKPLKKPLA